MRICIVARSLPPGYSGSFEYDQALALRNLGHDVHIISMDMRSIRRRRKLGMYSYSANGIPITVVSIPLGAINKKVFYEIGTKAFSKAFKKIVQLYGDFDIIHPHFFDNILMVKKALSCIMTNARFVATEHTNLSILEAYNRSSSMIDTVKSTYSSPECLITVSNDLKKIIKESYNADNVVVHNIVDINTFRFINDNTRTNNDTKTVVSVGNLTKNKRMDMLIRCFVKAFNNDSHYKLVICGGGSEIDSLEKEIKYLGCEKNVTLLGEITRQEIAGWFKKSDLFALLSQKETFGVAFIEAMASGLPVLSTKSGGPEDFIIDEVGVLLDDDEEIIASKMKEMVINSHYNHENISKYFIEHFSPEIVATKLIQIYKSLDNKERR